ncbi:MAG: CRISPR-associated helicase Cas3' [Oscillospiraceae bacterium]|jgi:CRISPR-associated endonuclease/helicase Cas3|nr:CRISPR-associated helicase Cas3' [Oscillospiraceae bacterium]
MDASALWAKKSKAGSLWLPLAAHLKDTAQVAEMLWSEWVPEIVRRTVADSIGRDDREAKRFFVFLAAIHDIGKATPVFQADRSFKPTDLDEFLYEKLLCAGFEVREKRSCYTNYAKTHHSVASQLLAENAQTLKLFGSGLNKNAAVILGAHHGKPPDEEYCKLIGGSYKVNLGIAKPAWAQAQGEMMKLALGCGGYASLDEVPRPTVPGQVLLSGLLIIADWIASCEDYFPLLPPDYPCEIEFAGRIKTGWRRLALPGKWEPETARCDDGLYADRFDNIEEPNGIQRAVAWVARDIGKPGITVIEAPMGSGKTEAALVAAEVFRNKSGSGGVFFALPTQATSDGIFPRLNEWIKHLGLHENHSVNLVHGKAQFNDEFTELKLFGDNSSVSDGEDEEDGGGRAPGVHQWFGGRKKAMLADFVVGTVDQLLLMALKQKHVMLRHVGIAGKVVIIDECHAYDAYMSEYLKMALRWLGAYGVPVIVLSATLNADTRREVIAAYLNDPKADGQWAQRRDYPLITYTDGKEVKSLAAQSEEKSRVVRIESIASEAVADKLCETLSEGGCAGVIMDTVKRAQDMARQLRARFAEGEVTLIHSRFIAAERLKKEEYLRKALGKRGVRPPRLVVVGTQVLEQSLDIDFDVMVSDIAPADLLLQRIGRLHRHGRERWEKLREPTCFITGIEREGFGRGIDSVYNKYLLMRTRDMFAACGAIRLPQDIAGLVNDVYDKNAKQTAEKTALEKEVEDKKNRARTFCIGIPQKKPDKTIVNWLRTSVNDKSGKRGEASVRDTHGSAEVLVVKEQNGEFYMLHGESLPLHALSAEQAKLLARQRLSLPWYLSDLDAITELEEITAAKAAVWQSSPWIEGELFLVLDGDNSATLRGHGLKYTKEDGLSIDDV